jgi:hypothetical protein
MTFALRAVLASLVVVLCASSVVGCAGGGAAPNQRPAAPAPGEPPPVITPVPETLAFEAGRFGLTMSSEGWTWKVLRRNLTRFDWSGRTTKGDRELLYSFFMDKLDDTSARVLPQIVASAAANLSESEPCPPIEQPPEVVRALGVDRVITVCFEPSTFYGKDRKGVMHGIVKEGALTIAVVLSNDRVPAAPVPSAIGARGSPRSR